MCDLVLFSGHGGPACGCLILSKSFLAHAMRTTGDSEMSLVTISLAEIYFRSRHSSRAL